MSDEAQGRERYLSQLSADIEASNSGRMITIWPDVPFPVEQKTIELGDRLPKLEELQKAVEGYIESVPLWETMEDGTACCVFCNENGKLDGMALNDKASRMWIDALERSTGSRECNDVLVGPIVIVTGGAEFMRRFREGDE